jgi:hypothetical protein
MQSGKWLQPGSASSVSRVAEGSAEPRLDLSGARFQQTEISTGELRVVRTRRQRKTRQAEYAHKCPHELADSSSTNPCDHAAPDPLVAVG